VIIWIVVLHNPPTQVFGLPNVCFARRLTDDHIRKESITHTLEPTIRRGELTADRSTAELLSITEGGGRLAKAQTAMLSRERSCTRLASCLGQIRYGRGDYLREG